MINWQPSATLEILRLRAEVLKKIRYFFAEREVMEVETPLLCRTSVTDPFIHSMPVQFKRHARGEAQSYYLQTSPEYAMKRLLAAGAGSIYQISKAFRQEEEGRFHNPEFTLLEWYRPQYNHHALMAEVDTLLQLLLQTPIAEKRSYAALFADFLKINPHTATLIELQQCASKHGIVPASIISDRDSWLHLLMTHLIEPMLGRERPCFVYDFPVTQAALAKIQASDPPVASRFEVYVNGIELANGFHELQDADEQRQRFEKNGNERKKLGLPTLPLDELFLAALAAGLPDCAGVALGVDRLLMLLTKRTHLSHVLSFDITRV